MSRTSVWFTSAIMLAALLAGLYARLKGLNFWPLAEDEFFMARAMSSIVESGSPYQVCENAGHYLRGLSYQYVSAALAWFGVAPTSALRGVAVAANLVAVPAVYLLAVRVGDRGARSDQYVSLLGGRELTGRYSPGQLIGPLAVVLFMLSLWEVEFARFARMYAPFQAIFLWYCVALHAAIVDRSTRATYLALALSLLGVVTWEGGVFLLAANLLLVFYRPQPFSWRLAGVVVVALAAGYRYLRGGQSLGQDRLPTDVEAANAVQVHFAGPVTLLPSLSSWWSVACFALVALVALALLVRVWRPSGLQWTAKATISCTLLFALANQFLLVGATLLIAPLVGWLTGEDLRRVGIGYLAGVVLMALGWGLGYGLGSTQWWALFGDMQPEEATRKLAVALFKFPNIYDGLAFPWMSAMPRGAVSMVLSVVLALALVWPRNTTYPSARLLLALSCCAVAFIGVLATQYSSTRYSFFVTPLLMIFVALAIERIASLAPNRLRALAGWGLLGLFMLWSEDYSWRHLLQIDSFEYNYRVHARDADHFYAREDYRSPAQYVNERLRPQDVVISSVVPSYWYLQRQDYHYAHYQSGEFERISCDRGQSEKWTRKPLLYRTEALDEVVRATSGTAWLLLPAAAREDDEHIDHALAMAYEGALAFTSKDEAVDVYAITTEALPR